MHSPVMIEVDHVSMKFNMSKEKVDGLKEYFIKFFKGQLLFEEFWAIKDVSFEISKGEIFGIVGNNGAGKSTLLKVIAGVLKPTTGAVKTFGTIAPLIELGAGFDHELTARENIYLNGTVLGYSKKMIKEKFEDIIEFSELGQFVDVPIKNYSSGMIARLGFSIATLIKPEILILDEVLSVGDFIFQEKCEKRIESLMSGGTSVIFVSHTIEQVERLCTKALWLDRGEIKMIGESSKVCESYKNCGM